MALAAAAAACASGEQQQQRYQAVKGYFSMVLSPRDFEVQSLWQSVVVPALNCKFCNVQVHGML
jgi:hypothetical protein